MHNINELIGIFKGIDFDNVINEQEVICLKNWVDKSRNLANTTEEIEFIKLLDDVLEDNIITSDEKRRVNAYIKKFMADDGAAAKLSELNGVIRGVISDGEVNTPEIVKLQAWLNQNPELLNVPHVRSLYNVLDDVITGQRITKEKQEEILKLLTEQLEEAQLKTRLDHLCNLVKTKKNIGPEVIELLDKQDAIDSIHKKAEKELDRALRSSSGNFFMNPEIVFISLVLIGMFKYNGNFYEGVEETYSNLYGKFSGQKIEGCIRSLISRYKPSTAVNSRTINLVLANSIVPSEYLGAFFAFIFDIYKINFDYDFDSSDDPYEEFKFIYEGLRSVMLNNSDDVTLKVTHKSYKLIKSTKELIINQYSLDALIKLSVMVLKLIDRRYWNQGHKIYNPYLKKGFSEWEKTIETATEHKRTRKSSPESYSRWEPKLCQNGHSVVIVPPVHRLKANNPETIKISVWNDDKEILTLDKLDIREIFGGYKVISPAIPVDAPLGKLQYRILADGNVVYDTKNKLYRDLIVFNESGEEIKNNTDYKGTAVFCYSTEISDLQSYYSNGYYYLAVKVVKYSDSYVVGSTVFSFSSLVKPGIYGELNQNCTIVDGEDGRRLPSFKEVKFLMFESSNKLARYNLVVDHKAYKLTSFAPTITEHDNKYKYVVDLKDFGAGLHNVSVMEHFDGAKKKLYSFDFAVDKGLEFSTQNLSGDSYEIAVASELMDEKFDQEVNLSDFSEKLIALKLNGHEYYYELPLELSIYRINGGVWRPLDVYIWIDEIKQDSVVRLYNPAADSVVLHLPTGETIGESVPVRKCGVYLDVPVGFLASYKAEHDYVVLVLMRDEKAVAGLYCYNKCVLRPDDIELNFDPVGEMLEVTAEYYGDGKVFFEVVDATGFVGYTSDFIMPGETVQVGDIPAFEKLSIIFYEKGKGLIKKNREIARLEKTFYGMSGLVGRNFRISEVYYDQYVRGQFLRKSRRFGNTYLNIISQKDNTTFTAKVYFSTRYNTYELFNVNPVTVEVCSTEIDGKLELAISKDGDGLLLDFANNGILNNVTDHNAVDIYSYNILLEEGKA